MAGGSKDRIFLALVSDKDPQRGNREVHHNHSRDGTLAPHLPESRGAGAAPCRERAQPWADDLTHPDYESFESLHSSLVPCLTGSAFDVAHTLHAAAGR